jgi:3-deoxy-manno-octulosonate cytidylyltransferase (CMP-KDO synthetase)
LIDAVAGELLCRPDCAMSTAAHAITQLSDFLNPNVVKVVADRLNTALYFSRAPIPWWRDGMPSPGSQGALPQPAPQRHIGIYAYRTGFLKRFPSLEPSPLEQTESLEQLRALWHGERIAVHLADVTPAPGVDTPEDLERVRQLFSAMPQVP